MLTPEQLYPLVVEWLHALAVGGPRHTTALNSLAALVTALLLSQSLRPSALMRTLPSPRPVPARQRYKRLARSLDRLGLAAARLTPRLVRAALALVPADPERSPTAGQTHLALDSVRCGGWEIFTLGVVWHGRVLPVGWRVLPYPWPKQQFTPTVCALLRQVAAAWPDPAERPVVLVADRAFPSGPLFQTLASLGWGWSVRLRASSRITVAGHPQWARDQLVTARLGCWTAQPASFGSGPRAVAGTLVVGRGLPVVSWHQRTEGSLRHREQQRARRQQHLCSKHPGRRPDASAETDGWLILFTSYPLPQAVRAAPASYRRRWPTEGSYRDAQSGWDGQHGWQLEGVVARQRTAERVEHLVGLWALGALLQSWLGHHVAQPTVPSLVQAVVAEWTTTGRLSVWARGHLALTEPTGRLRDWLLQALWAGARQLAAAPPLPAAVLPLPTRRVRLPRRAA